MKNRINKLLKIGILCFVFVIALTYTSCETNDNSINNEVQQEKKINRVSFSDFNSNVVHNRQYQDLEKHFDASKKSNQNLQNRIDADDDITVLTDEILVIQKNDISYYTFKIVAPTENNEFYNLVVHVNNQQQIIKSELYEYIPDNDWLQDINQPYTGLIKVLDNDIISLDDLFSARGSGRCLTGASGEWECNFGNNHAPGECNGSSFEYIITLEYGPCPQEPVDYIIAEAPDLGGSGGGGGGGSSNENPTPTIPTTPCEQNDDTSTQTIGITDGNGDCLDIDTLNNIQIIENCLNNSTIDLYSLSENNISSISNFININGCSEEAQVEVIEFLNIIEEIPNAKFERFKELNEIIEDDPWALIQDCAQQNGLNTSNYLDLYNLPFPQECSNRLFNMGVEWHHQPITDGNVPLANIDYYGVEVTNYPDFNNDGNPDSESEIYQKFREKFTNLASGEVDNFQFSCNILFNSDNTGDINWEFIPLTNQDGIDFISNDPIASILLIEADATGILPTIATDDGAVIVSDFTANDWTISTITTANNGTQPFSGNRQWGWIINQNGNFEFFTRAVDVANISVLLNIGANTECQQETYYDIAEATWENLQQEIVDWINSPESNGGQASIIPKTAIRVDKEKIEELLIGNETINQINCD